MSRTRWSLIGEALRGEPEAQRAFVDRYRPFVIRILTRRGLGADAEDVAQDVFVRLFGGALEGAGPDAGSFRAYLYAVTRHALGDHLTRERAKKRGGGAVEALGEREPAAAIERAEFDQEWLLHILELAMARLRAEHPNYFEAVRGYLWEERSQGDLAARVGRPVQDIRNHVHRGRKKLVEYLREEVFRCEREPSRHRTELEYLSKLFEGGAR